MARNDDGVGPHRLNSPDVNHTLAAKDERTENQSSFATVNMPRMYLAELLSMMAAVALTLSMVEATDPWLDASKPVPERVNALLPLLSLDVSHE